MLRKWILSVLGLGLAGAANADWELNMPTGVTELSAETYGLHMMVFWWCVGQISGCRTGEIYAQHERRDCLDGNSGRYPAIDGGARGRDHGET